MSLKVNVQSIDQNLRVSHKKLFRYANQQKVSLDTTTLKDLHRNEKSNTRRGARISFAIFRRLINQTIVKY
jgi:hypothetical protein